MTAAGIRTRFWIDMALECVRRDHTMGPSLGDQKEPFLSARALGMALGALYDVKAFAAGTPTLLRISAPAELTAVLTAPDQVDLAAAAACHEVFRLQHPNQASMLEPAWLNWLDHFSLGAAGSPTEKAGRVFGTVVHQLGQRPNQFTKGCAGGAWGNAHPLDTTRAVIANPVQQFRDDFTKGGLRGDISRTPDGPGARTLRTLAQEVIGLAWGYDGSHELGTPPRLYLQVVLTILDSIAERNPGQLQDLDELAVVAGVAVAMADAGIDAWHSTCAPTPGWRPLGFPDSNGRGTGLTPDSPASPSGHATFGAAAFQLLRLFLVEKGVSSFNPDGVDDVRFEFISDECHGRHEDPPTKRPRDLLTLGYDSLWQAICENSVSRVYLGVDWQFDGTTTGNANDDDDKFDIAPTPCLLGPKGAVWFGAQIANQIAPRLNISPATIAASGIC
jgi:hypothetical protein